jgi:hypothetical protein
MLKLQDVSRWKAAGLYLVASTAVGATVFALMMFLWYPPPYFDASGGGRLFLLMLGVDVCLGPLVVLVVFNPAKRSLRMDLAMVAAVQFGALLYGLSVMYSARPVYLVFTKDRFDLVAANEIDEGSLAKAKGAYSGLPLTGPRVVGVRYPTDKAEMQKLVTRAVAGDDISQFPEYFVPFDDVAPVAAMKGHPVGDLRKKDPASIPVIDEAVRKSGRNEEQVEYLAVKAREAYAALIDGKTGDLLALVPANPWK